MTAHADLIDAYFARAAGPDVDAYLDLFVPGAIVTDENHIHRGADAIRTWRATSVPVRYEILDTVSGRGGTVARVRVSGEFDGSPVVLAFAFAFGVDPDRDDTNAGARISSLTISPAESS